MKNKKVQILEIGTIGSPSIEFISETIWDRGILSIYSGSFQDNLFKEKYHINFV